MPGGGVARHARPRPHGSGRAPDGRGAGRDLRRSGVRPSPSRRVSRPDVTTALTVGAASAPSGPASRRMGRRPPPWRSRPFRRGGVRSSRDQPPDAGWDERPDGRGRVLDRQGPRPLRRGRVRSVGTGGPDGWGERPDVMEESHPFSLSGAAPSFSSGRTSRPKRRPPPPSSTRPFRRVRVLSVEYASRFRRVRVLSSSTRPFRRAGGLRQHDARTPASTGGAARTPGARDGLESGGRAPWRSQLPHPGLPSPPALPACTAGPPHPGERHGRRRHQPQSCCAGLRSACGGPCSCLLRGDVAPASAIASSTSSSARPSRCRSSPSS